METRRPRREDEEEKKYKARVRLREKATRAEVTRKLMSIREHWRKTSKKEWESTSANGCYTKLIPLEMSAR